MSRLIDADDKENIVIVQDDRGMFKRIDAPTVQAVPIDVLQEIRAEIDNADMESVNNVEYHKGLTFALDVIDKHLNKSGFEIWNSIHGERIVVPKGTFMQIYNDDEEENDVI